MNLKAEPPRTTSTDEHDVAANALDDFIDCIAHAMALHWLRQQRDSSAPATDRQPEDDLDAAI